MHLDGVDHLPASHRVDAAACEVDYWLSGLSLAVLPWVGGFAGNAAAWISWVAGLALLVIARVHPLIVDNRPTRRLLDEWGNAQLVVVGGRGRGGIDGMLLGSVSAALVHRAPIPVTVARQQHNSVPPHAETTTAE